MTTTETQCEMCEAEALQAAVEAFLSAHGRWPEPGEETASLKTNLDYGYLPFLEGGYSDHDYH